MAVLVASHRILVVIQVNSLQAGKPDDFIEMGENAVGISCDVVAAVIDVAGIKAHAHAVLALNLVDNRGQLLKRASDFRPLPCHRFKQDKWRQLFLIHGVIQHVCNHGNRNFCALLQVGARMEIVKAVRQVRRFGQVLTKRRAGKLTHRLLRRAAVHRVSPMAENRPEIMLLHPRLQSQRIRFLHRSRLASARVSREELKRISADRSGCLPHGKIPARDG